MATVIDAQKRFELANALQTLGLSNALLRPAHEVFTTIEKGRGIRATRSIPRGTLIFDEKPLFSISHCEDDLTAQNLEEIEQSAKQHQEFRHLDYRRATKGSRQTSANIRRFELNNIEMINREGRRGIFVEASCLNHSCLPNAYFDYNEEWERLTLYAIRNIDMGQEILVSYRSVDWYQTREKRRAELVEHYGFNCTCEYCGNSGDRNGLGEQRRRKIPNDWKKYQRLQRGRLNVEDQSGHLGDLIAFGKLLEFEGLVYPAQADVCRIVAEECHNLLVRRHRLPETLQKERRSQGLEHARQKLCLDVMATGQDSRVVVDTLEWMVGLHFG